MYAQNYFNSLGYHNVSIGFQNHGGKGTTFPQTLFAWSSPPDTDVVPILAKSSCSHILISGIISFVVDNSETEFDERIDDVRQIKAIDASKQVFVPEVFSSGNNGYKSNAAFHKYLAGVVDRAMEGKGDVKVIKEKKQIIF
jgi:hypothetical protein